MVVGNPAQLEAERARRETEREQGPGLAPGEEERVFERYYRGAERSGQPGLGLGLYLARRVVEQHGGRLVAERPAAGGGRFVCRLPASCELEQGLGERSA